MANILDLEPDKIQKLSGGVQAPQIKVANEDISQAVGNLANTLMTISGSVIQENKRKEIAKRKDIVKQEKENLKNYNEIFLIQTSEKMNGGYAQLNSNMEQYYDDPSTFIASTQALSDNFYKSVSDDKSLTPVSKAKLQAQNDKSYRETLEKFRVGEVEFSTNRNNKVLEELGNKLINNIPNYMFDGDEESAHKSIVALVEVVKLGMETNPDEWTNENVKRTFGLVASRYIESRVGGQLERWKGTHDLNTEEGVNDYINQLVEYSKGFNSKEIKNFFGEVFKDMPFEQKNISAKVHGMVKKQIEQELYLANARKGEMTERTLKQVREDQLEPQGELQREGLVYTGEESNNGYRAVVVGNLLDREFSSSIEAGKVAETNGDIYSLYHKTELSILKKSIEQKIKVNDSRGIIEILGKEYDNKVLDEDGFVAFEYDREMFYLDIAEATGGVIDRNFFKAYIDKNEEVLDDYETSMRWSSKNDLLNGQAGDLTLNDLGETTVLGFIGSPWDSTVKLFKDAPMKVINETMTYISRNKQDVNEPERLRDLANNWAYGYFYENILSDDEKLLDFNKAKDKDKMKMIDKFYRKRQHMEKLQQATERLSKNFLEGNIVEVKTGGMESKLLVSDEFKDLNFEEIKESAIQESNLVFQRPDGTVSNISPFKLRANLIIETIGEDRIGLYYKDKEHPLMYSSDGKLVMAETNLDTIGIFSEDIKKEKFVKKFEVNDVMTKEMKKVMKIRNVRNNNAGNLKEVGIPWKGKMEGTDSGGRVASGSFTRFSTPQFGVRALKRDLTTKIGRGLNTIDKILNVYAPSGRENDTEAYIKAVSKATGIGADQKLTEKDMFELVKAIISHEGGRSSLLYYTDTVIREGMELK